MDDRLDTLIVGAGIVGCAVAYALRHRRENVYWIEAAGKAGTGMTSRNSGVIHAGIYYPADSLKTRLCRQGRQQLYAFAAKHGVPHRRTGKYIVANDAGEVAYLEQLKAGNKEVPLEWVKDLPAGIRAQKALFSPTTGIIDQHALVHALIAACDREPIFGQKITAMHCRDDLVQVHIGDEVYSARRVFNCTGLQAAAFAEGRQHVMAQGAYFQVEMPKQLDLPPLIYPAVPKGSSSLGIHLTQNIHGEAFLGPDLTWIETEHYGVSPLSQALFFDAAQRYLPWLKLHMLRPGYAGIRAKLSRHHFSDFLLETEGAAGQLMHCLGIESPGLTAALALGEEAVRRMGL